MPNAFETAAAAASKVIDAKGGRMFRILPMSSGKGWASSQSDAARLPLELTATFQRRPAQIEANNKRLGKDFDRPMAMQEISVTCENAAIADVDVRIKDRLLDIDRAGQFEIVAIEPHGPVRTRFILVEVQ